MHQLASGHQAMINSLAAFQAMVIEDNLTLTLDMKAGKAEKALAAFVVEFGKDLKEFMRAQGYVVTVVVSKRGGK